MSQLTRMAATSGSSRSGEPTMLVLRAWGSLNKLCSVLPAGGTAARSLASDVPPSANESRVTVPETACLRASCRQSRRWHGAQRKRILTRYMPGGTRKCRNTAKSLDERAALAALALANHLDCPHACGLLVLQRRVVYFCEHIAHLACTRARKCVHCMLCVRRA